MALFPTLCLIFVYINSSILAHSSCYSNQFLAICPLITPITSLMLIRVDKVISIFRRIDFLNRFFQHSKTESKAGKGLPNRPPPSAGPFSSPPPAWRGEVGGGGPPQGPPPGYTSRGPGSGPSQSQQPGPWMKGFEPPPPPSIRNR